MKADYRIVFHELRFYSVGHGMNVRRIAALDGEGREHVAFVASEGRGARHRREAAFRAVEASIRERRGGGEVPDAEVQALLPQVLEEANQRRAAAIERVKTEGASA